MSIKTIAKSIYVAISVLEWDTELPVTIWSCFQNSSGKNNIVMGIAYISTTQTFDRQKTETPELFMDANIKVKHYRIEENYGIGRGRNAAYSMYGGEDYVLQVDAHSYFSKNWDSDLIESLHNATKITNNKRTVITGIPEPYWYPKDKNYELSFDENDVLGYPYWTTGWWWVEDAIPRWGHRNPRHVTPHLERLILETGFAPAIKVSGAFMFCTKEIIPFTGLHEEFLFWEEEIVQSIELIDNGFTLVYPYICPVRHMYCEEDTDEYGGRAIIDDVLIEIGVERNIFIDIANNMKKYFTNRDNHKKIKRYEDYAGVYLGDARTKRYFVFKDSIRRNQYQYINVGAFPLE